MKHKNSLWASSPIWASEASLARTCERAAKLEVPVLARLASLAQIGELARGLTQEQMEVTILLKTLWSTNYSECLISESSYQRKLVRVITDHIAGLLEHKKPKLVKSAIWYKQQSTRYKNKNHRWQSMHTKTDASERCMILKIFTFTPQNFKVKIGIHNLDLSGRHQKSLTKLSWRQLR